MHGLKLYFSEHVLKLGYSSSYKLTNGGGDAKSMLDLIAHVWKIKTTLINYLGYDAEFIVFGPNDEGISHADIYIIYNGWSHYTLYFL